MSSSTTTSLLISDDDDRRRSFREQSLRQASRLLRRASSRRMMREPSMIVRETAAEQLEERQSDWAYSKPVVILDIFWNFGFIIFAATVLLLSGSENPVAPLRLWIVVYALQCLLHVVCVSIEYRLRRRRQLIRGLGIRRHSGSGYVSLAQLTDEGTSVVAKHLESANTMFSFVWWIIGFYWVSAGSQALADDSPQLYWLCIVFLAFDVLFVVFCVVLACFIGIAVCCCLPCIIGVLYLVTDEEGASKEDIEQLPKYKFRRFNGVENFNSEIQAPCGIMTECDKETPTEHLLSSEDAECCICLCLYDDGVELRELPCGHHFHCTCIDKWLCINATCPLCKYNILRGNGHSSEEV